MALDEEIFETMAETPYSELDTETIQKWIDTSKKYHNSLDVHPGVHAHDDCEDAEGSCCRMCNKGHVIITGVSERDSGNVVNALSCTHEGCPGISLAV